MSNDIINREYQKIIGKCKFISKPNEWFIEGSEAKCSDYCSYETYNDGDKFNSGWCLFRGVTNETFEGYTGELPRDDGEICSFDEFFIYDEFGNEISELTFYEYKKIIRKEKLKKLNVKKCNR